MDRGFREVSTDQIRDSRSVSQRMIEKSMHMRALAYLSEVKASLLTQTIFEIGKSKKQVASLNKGLRHSRDHLEQQVEQRTKSLQESESRYQELYDHAPDMFVSVDAETGIILQCNRTLADNLGYARNEIIGRPIFDMYHPDCLPDVKKAFKAFTETGLVREAELQLKRKDGSRIVVMLNASAIRDENGRILHSSSTWRDITKRKRAEMLLAGQKQVLEMIAAGAHLPEILTALVHLIEAQSPGMLGSILLLDEDGVHVRQGAAPSLPAEFNAAVDGQPIGPSAGSCGTALYRRQAVFVEDIATDPLWENYKAAALPHGLHACWSTPIFDAGQRVLGSFAMYYRKPGLPQPEHLRLIDIATHIAAIAISRHREEGALRESEQRFREIAENIHEVFWMSDPDKRRMLYVSPAYEEIWGRSCQSLYDQPRSFLDAIHPEDRDRVIAAMPKQPEGGYDEQYRVVRPDGSIRWIHDHAFPVLDAQGKAYRVTGVAEDITERKLAEEALRQSQERLRNIIDGLGPNMFVGLLTTEGVVLEANQQALSAAGLKQEDVLGKPVEETYWFSYSEESKCKMRDSVARASRGEALRFDVQIRAAENQYIPLDFSIQPFLDDTGRVVLLVPSAIVITERKQAEAERQKFVMLADSSSEFIGMCDLDMKPHYVNPAGMRMVGLPDLAAACRVKVEDYFFPEDQRFIAEEFFPRVLRDGHGDVEIRLRHFQTGEPIWMFYYLFSVRDASGTTIGWATVSRDITKRKQAEEKIREQLDELLRWQAVMLGREQRVQQLKAEVNELLAAQAQPRRYTGPAS